MGSQSSSGEEFDTAEYDELNVSGDESVIDFEKKDICDIKGWRMSEPPEEVFTDVERDMEWTFEIIGEEVDENNNPMFEVRWDDWARKDGTKTTWSKPEDINADLWKREQRKRRAASAMESLEIDPMLTTDIHNLETFLVQQAFKEKKKRHAGIPRKNLLRELEKLQDIRQEQDEGTSGGEVNQGSSLLFRKRDNRRESTRQNTELSLANSSARLASTRSTISNAPSTSSIKSESSSANILSHPTGKCVRSSPDSDDDRPLSSPAPENNSLSLLKKRAFNRTQIIQSDSDDELESTSITVKHPPLKRCRVSSPTDQRLQLEKEWTRIAARDKAAPIYFVNTVDAEPVPGLPPGFVYLESRYQFSPGVPQPADVADFLVKCSSKYCSDITACECQDASSLVDEMGNPILAYTPDGYFAFNVPSGTEVVECNKLCVCSFETCRNRVSQCPRDIAVQVFKTESRGWGVRPLVDVKRGKVLGLYTGLVIPREIARSHHDHVDSDYVFDLDGDEDEDNQMHHPLFSVDSRLHGNWTRFLNHSCSPNVQIYLVVHDIPPGNGLPFIAFVALADIPAKTEFTLDYDPRLAEQLMMLNKAKKKGKGHQTRLPEGVKFCNCGTKECRGFLYS